MSSITRDEVLKRAAGNHLTFVATAFSFLRDWSAAEDVVQEAYLVISRKWQEYRPEKSIVPWTRSIVRHKCMEYRKAHRTEFAFSNEYIEDKMEAELERQLGEASSDEMEEQIRVLQKCIRKLTKSSQQLLHDFYVKGRMCKDIASDAGMEEKTPVMRLWRLRSKLRNCMQKKNIQEERSEHEEALDSFFIRSQLDPSQVNCVLNAIESKELDIAAYVKEWTVFASAFSRGFDNEVASEGIAEQQLHNNSFIKRDQSDVIQNVEDKDLANIATFGTPVIRRNIYVIATVAACIALGFFLWGGKLINQDNQVIATIVSGTAKLQAVDAEEFNEVSSQETIRYGDTIRTENGVPCEIEFHDQTTFVEIIDKSELQFSRTKKDKGHHIKMNWGEMWVTLARQETGNAFSIDTPQSTIQILGTRFRLKVNSNVTTLFLESGRLLVTEKQNGEKSIVTAGQHVAVENGQVSVNSSVNTQDLADDFSDSLILWYPFEETEKFRIIDSSKHERHVLLPEFAELEKIWIKGPVGRAIDFTLFEEYPQPLQITLSEFGSLPIDREFSIAFWLQCRQTTQGQFRAQSFINCAINKESGFQVLIKDQADESYRLIWRFLKEMRFVVRQQLKKDSWHHVLFTLNSGLAKCYINGVFAQEHEFPFQTINLPEETPLKIGPFDPPQDMALDEILVLSKELQRSHAQKLAESNVDLP